MIFDGSDPVSEGCLLKVTLKRLPGSIGFLEFIRSYSASVRWIVVPSLKITLMRSFWDLSFFLLGLVVAGALSTLSISDSLVTEGRARSVLGRP